MAAVSVTINNHDGTFRKLEGAPAAVANEVYRLLSEGIQAGQPTVNMPPNTVKSTRYEPVQPAPQTLAGFGHGGSLVPAHLTLPPPPTTYAPPAAKRAGRGHARQPQQYAPQPVATRPPHGQQPLQTLSTAEPIEGWPGQLFGGKPGEGVDRTLQAIDAGTRSAVASQPLTLPPSSFEA